MTPPLTADFLTIASHPRPSGGPGTARTSDSNTPACPTARSPARRRRDSAAGPTGGAMRGAIRVASPSNFLLTPSFGPTSRASTLPAPSASSHQGQPKLLTPRGHLVPRPAIERAARLLLPHAAPLFEEERHTRAPALRMDVPHPVGMHRTRPRPGPAPDD